MRILVLGGSGFIGSHLVESLLKKGNTVRVFSRSADAAGFSGSVEIIRADFSDGEQIRVALQGCDMVCHLISTMVPSLSNSQPRQDIEENLVNTVQLLDIMREVGVDRIMYLSSGGAVYGQSDKLPLKEDAECHPNSSYGIVKLAIEQYLDLYRRMYGISPVVIRPGNPYGPTTKTKIGFQGIVPTIFDCIKNRYPLTVWGDGELARDYIYISDLVDLCIKAIESNVIGVFNAGAGTQVTVNNLVERAKAVSSSDLEVIYKEIRECDMQDIALDCDKALKEFSWSPAYSLDGGLKMYWEWLKSQESQQA